MSKVKKDESLMEKVEELIKPLRANFDEESPTPPKKQGPVNISSGDEGLDNAFKTSLRKRKSK
jgi:hypothetical protein